MSDKIKRDMRDIDDFTKVELWGWGNISLMQGEACQVVIEGDTELLDHLEVYVQKDTLILKFDDDFNKVNWKRLVSKEDTIDYNITLPKLESIKILGKGSCTATTLTGDSLVIGAPGVGNFKIEALHYARVAIEVKGVSNTKINQISADALALSIKGTGKIIVDDVQAKSLATAIKGSGTMQVAGKVENQSVSVPGVGNYNAEHLETQATTLISNGMTSATIWAKDALNVTLRGMGNVRYYGNPSVRKTIRGMGHIKHLGESPHIKV